MARFRDIIRNGPLARATQGNVWPLVASTVGGLVGGPVLGQLAGSFVGNRMDRRDRRNAVPFSPSPESANAPQGLRDELGLTNWSGGGADSSGRFGPLMGSYAGLPEAPQDQGPKYDSSYLQNLGNSYSQPGLMPSAMSSGTHRAGVTSGNTRGFGNVQSTTDIGGILDQLAGNSGGGGTFLTYQMALNPPER